jgi:tripartite ATP-independent transporter DctM subunit
VTLVLFALFAALLFTGIPMAFAIGIAATATVMLTENLPLASIVTRMFVGLDSYSLLAIPFFIATGEIMNAAGITERIIRFSRCLVGHIRGGLAHVTVVSTMFFSDISGSATADASAIGSMMIPAMVRNRFDRDFAVAVTASASAMGPMVPPSILMVIYGSLANVSIAKLFLGGFIPAFLIAGGLMLVAYGVSVRRGYSAEMRASLRELWESFRAAVLALMMPVIVLGGLLGGIFTATEAGVVATVYALIVGCFVYRTIAIRQIGELLLNAAVTAGSAMMIIATASIFAWLLAWFGFGANVVTTLLAMSRDPTIVMFLIITFILLLGFFVEGIPVLIIFTPILIPVVSLLHIDPIYFGVVLVMTVVIGSVTPFVGVLVFMCCTIGRVNVSEVAPVLLPFYGVMVVVLFFVAYFPSVVMLIPSMAH